MPSSSKPSATEINKNDESAVSSASGVEANETVGENVSVTSKATPKIKTIEVLFSKVIRDINKRVIPVGTATATYDNGTTLTVDISGGSSYPTYGMTDAVTNRAIFRVEKSTYLNHLGQPMPFALFYNGGEALHVGSITKTSHGCVHVGDRTKMQKLNADSIKNKTAVTVKYAAGILDKVKKKIM